jgi:1,4-dihydroxy-2-naphthoyl-CoA hydrolase
MSIWKTSISLAHLNERGRQTMVEHLAIEFINIGESHLEATMPVDQRTKQPIGIMHGGASCVLAETVGSTAANYAIDITDYYCVGLSINTNHIRAVRTGWVRAHASPLHIGQSTQVWNIDIFDEQQRLISSTRLTMAILKRKKLD